MVSKRKHLDVARFFIEENFKSKRTGRNPGVPGRNRNQHGSHLRGQYQNLIDAYDQKREHEVDTITDDSGIYVEIISVDGCKLPLDSLDNRDFKLCSCQMRENKEFALVQGGSALCLIFNQRIIVPDNHRPRSFFSTCFAGLVRNIDSE